MTEFVTRNQWDAIQRDLRSKRSPVTAVVSFIGKGADTLMPLRRGDRLVCNADEATIRRGLTNPDALRRFHRKGVEVYSVVGLHAKVISGPISPGWVPRTHPIPDTLRRLFDWAQVRRDKSGAGQTACARENRSSPVQA